MNGNRKPLVAGNWKMNKTLAEAASLAREIRQGYQETMAAEVVLAPPFTALARVAQELSGSSHPIGGPGYVLGKAGRLHRGNFPDNA